MPKPRMYGGPTRFQPPPVLDLCCMLPTEEDDDQDAPAPCPVPVPVPPPVRVPKSSSGTSSPANPSAGVDLLVDLRERALFQQLQMQLKEAGGGGLRVVSQVLDLGDVHIVLRGPEEGARAERWVVERKTLADLAASIKDGRWREQKARLLANVDAARVLYVLEGPTSLFSQGANGVSVSGIPASTLASCVLSAMVKYGVQVMFTRDVGETAALLHALSAKVRSCGSQRGSSGEQRHAAVLASSSAVSARKRDNVDPQQCFLQQLCQLPGVSVTIATVLADRFGSMHRLYRELGPLDEQARVRVLSGLPMIAAKGALRMSSYLFPDDQ